MSLKTLKPDQTESVDIDALKQLVHRAEHGDLSVLDELRLVLTERPELWQHYGDLGLQSEAALIKLAAGTNLLLAESLMHKLAGLKAEMVGPEATPLEKLLAQRVAACWLQVSYYDAYMAQVRELTPKQADDLRKRQDSSHRRFLAATKMLGTVRRLVKPALSPVDLALKSVPEGSPGRHSRRLRMERVEEAN